MALLSALAKARDELVKLGYPEEVAENIVSGRLDMRSPARSERQQDLNPDIFYTGTTSPDIINTPPSRTEIGTGISPQFLFGSESPALAASYAGKKQGRFADESPTIYPFAIDTTGFDRLLGDRSSWNALENPRIELGGDPENIYTSPGIGYHTDDIAQMSYELGSPGLLMQDVIDPGPYTKLMRMGLQGKKENVSQFEFDNFLRGLEQAPPTNVVVPDTTRVRSLFGAAFDPEYKGSNILGDRAIPVAGAGLLAAAALAPEEAEAGVIKAFGREFDPRFDPRAKEQERLRNATFAIEDRGTQDMPRLALSSLEGRPFVTTQSDRTQAGGLLTRINDVDLNVPVDLRGGQGFMFENPAAWASGGNVITSLMKARDEFPGENPLILPYRMTPTGGDFATMTGETMIGYASANMTSKTKKQLDKQIKELIPEWKGVDNPESIKQFQNAKTNVRKYIQQQVMDVNFRNEGGLSIGEARLAVTDPKQAQAGDLQIQNIGEIFAGARTPSDHPAYPFNLPGQGLGYTDQEVNIFELMPEARVGADQRLVADPQRPTRSDARALEMKPYTGRITDDTLRGLEARGVNVNANPMVTAAAVAAGQEAEGLLAQLPQKDSEAYNYSDVLPIKRSKDPEEREGLLGGYSPAYTGVVEDMIEGLLKFSTQAKRGIYNPAAASEFLL